MPLRVFQFLYWTDAAVGGPARASIDLSLALTARGHHVTYAAVDDRGVPDDWRGQGSRERPDLPTLVSVPCRYLPAKTLPTSALRRLTEAMKGHDLLHVHGVWDVCNIQLARAAERLGIPYFVSVRGMLDDWCMGQKSLKKKAFLAVAVRAWLERAAAVHLTAEYELEQSRKHFPRGRGVVIPNLTDLSPFSDLPGPELARAKFPILQSGRPLLLFLSRIHIKKGLETLLRAVGLLKSRGVEVMLAVAGTGDPAYVDSLKRLTAELGIEDRVAYLGQVVGRDKLSLYQAADLFTLATSQENFGFVFIESLASGTPVLTTRGVDIWPELEASGGAVIADPTPGAFADAIAGLLARRSELPAMGERGRDWVFRELDPRVVIEHFERMYLLPRGPTAAQPHGSAIPAA